MRIDLIMSKGNKVKIIIYNGHTIHHNEMTNTFTVLLMKSPGVVDKTMQARSLRAAQIMITKYNSEV